MLICVRTPTYCFLKRFQKNVNWIQSHKFVTLFKNIKHQVLKFQDFPRMILSGENQLN